VLGVIKKYNISKSQSLGFCLFLLIALGYPLISNDSFATLIPYSANTIDKANRNVSPFETQEIASTYYRHWLGTDPLGRDVLAGILSGSRIALVIGFTAVFLTLIIGVFFGYLSGYIGDHGFRVEKKWLLLSIFCFLLLAFYIFFGHGLIRYVSIFLCALLVFFFVSRGQERISKSTVAIPFDLIIMRLIEIIRSIPDIFIILVFLSLFKRPSYWNVILIIALLRWSVITRYLRAEILKIKEKNYITSAKAIGLPNRKIFIDHVLPLSIGPVIVASVFGFSTAILLESSLSFLGIGVPVDQVTWGSILNLARHNFSSWWLALFPGLAIFLVIWLFNTIGNNLNEYFAGKGEV